MHLINSNHANLIIDTPRSVIARLSESFLNEQARPDGEVLRNIIRRRGNEPNDGGCKSVESLKVLLTMRKNANLDQLLKDNRYRDAFDNLVKWQGLWSTIQIGSFHRLLTMKCHEVEQTECIHLTNADVTL